MDRRHVDILVSEEDKLYRKEIIVKGKVQGVGFRPFVYRIALDNKLKGWVKNTTKGVVIEVQGDTENIDNFLIDIKEKAPKISYIEEVIVNEKFPQLSYVEKIKGEEKPLQLSDIKQHMSKKGKSLGNFAKFSIIESSDEEDGITLISPDIATCEECEEELWDRDNPRRYLYPFTNCTNCGPRFSIIKATPYDRKYTTMEPFEMCEDCRAEYENPLNRRFHAEPTCCSKCGPKLTLLNGDKEVIQGVNEIEQVKQFLRDGKIIGVKGIGGFNLICNGEDGSAIEKLRKRKSRKSKALALMMRDVEVVFKYCEISEIEKEILTGNKKPIVILKKKNNNNLPYNISFNNKRLGVLLPYTPLHYLLFDEELQVIVFTSGNLSEIPITYKDSEAIDKLKNVADYFLVHNREINMPIDDSVTSVVLNEERLIRGGRGYAPSYNKYNLNDGNSLYNSEALDCRNSLDENHIHRNNILALGSQFKNTFSLSNGKEIFTSPYIGDMESVENYHRFEKNLEYMKRIYKIEPSIVVHDMHPNYWCNKYLEEQKGKTIGVYHHHSHIVSCMAENKVRHKVIGIAFDGIGYGEDGNLWGGEFLICDNKEFVRGAHINYIPMPGGDGAVKSPWKMGISLLYKALKEDSLVDNTQLKKSSMDCVLGKCFKGRVVNIIVNMIEKKFNSPLSSSMGRLFDGVASILGFHEDISYEGEAALYLQNLSEDFTDSFSVLKKSYSYEIQCESSPYVVNTNKIVMEILKDLENSISKGEIAFKFHNTIIEFSHEISLKLREAYNINTVALSGGVFQNPILLVGIKKRLEQSGFNVITHKLIPCNDGGLSIGQVIIANELCKE